MLYTPLKSNIYLSGMSCISCKEIAFLTIINLKNDNYKPPGPHWVGLQHPLSCSYPALLTSLGLLCFAQKVFLVFY